MATVFLAHDVKHDRSVALKVLHPELALALGTARFAREIRLAARLQHTNILSVYDSGESSGHLWFTMPYVAGESLRDRLSREKQLPVEEAVRIAREVAEALDYAHRQGVIHRDIKPENILLAEGHAMVADFGIARAVGTGDQPLTGTGVAIGTPAYMSPEQGSGTWEVDARTDVYALGCVLFEMLAGEPPYTGPTPQAIMARALTETPRPIHPMRLAVPEALDAVIAKATAATAADRFAGAAEFAECLALSTGEERRRQPRPITQLFAHRPLFVVLTLGVLLGAGALFAWRRSHGGDEASSAKLVAVLPFENLGSPEVEYVVDGISDEVRGRLSTVPGVQVIARGSSMSYKRTGKPQQQIAHELGVRYLLTATVRWETAPGGARRLHVSPELVQVGSGGAPRARWQQSFDVDASLTDVFQMYGDIGDRVARALGVALVDSSRRGLASRPTSDSAAYLAFLKGEEVSRSVGTADAEPLRRASTYYAQAVARDSGFVQAWAQLSRVHSTLYIYSTPSPAEAQGGRHAAERALSLAPNRPEGHLAMGTYYWAVEKDYARAAEEFDLGLEIAPSDPTLLGSSAIPEFSLGRWEAALAHLQRAQTLDPNSEFNAWGVVEALLWLRRYPQAQASVDRALSLSPTNQQFIQLKAMIALAQGDVVGARAVIAGAPKEVNPVALAAFFAQSWDLYWILDDAQQALLLGLQPSAFDDDRAAWGAVLAQTYWLRGDKRKARLYADSARLAFQDHLKAAPQDAQQHVLLGLSLAYLGRNAEAVREGQRGVALLPMTQDANEGPYLQLQLVRTCIIAGEQEKAVVFLEPLLNTPFYLSPGWLKVDPNFDPLRNNPRFQRLVARGS
jgi:serine/threonine protein kinase/tetratricopeptide (TPR) repeat protein